MYMWWKVFKHSIWRICYNSNKTYSIGGYSGTVFLIDTSRSFWWNRVRSSWRYYVLLRKRIEAKSLKRFRLWYKKIRIILYKFTSRRLLVEGSEMKDLDLDHNYNSNGGPALHIQLTVPQSIPVWIILPFRIRAVSSYLLKLSCKMAPVYECLFLRAIPLLSTAGKTSG